MPISFPNPSDSLFLNLNFSLLTPKIVCKRSLSPSIGAKKKLQPLNLNAALFRYCMLATIPFSLKRAGGSLKKAFNANTSIKRWKNNFFTLGESSDILASIASFGMNKESLKESLKPFSCCTYQMLAAIALALSLTHIAAQALRSYRLEKKVSLKRQAIQAYHLRPIEERNHCALHALKESFKMSACRLRSARLKLLERSFYTIGYTLSYSPATAYIGYGLVTLSISLYCLQFFQQIAPKALQFCRPAPFLAY